MAKLKDPDDKGGDNNKFYEDKVALLWPIGNSIAGFDKDGCFAACHDDGWLDHTRYDPEKAKEAGRKTDAKTAGGYTTSNWSMASPSS